MELALVLSAVVAVIAVAVFVRVVSNRLHGRCPPVYEDIPFIGGVMGFVRSPIRLVKEGYKRYGEVFTVPVLHLRMTFLIGPSVTPHFFNASDELMSQKEVYGYSVPTFGKGVVFGVDDKVRAEQFRLLATALKSSTLHTYIPGFVSETVSYFSEWGQSGVIDFREEFSKLILFTASATILGREVREGMFDEVTHLYEQLDAGMQPISVIAPYLPTKLHKRRDEARAAIGRIFADIIAKRRASGRKENDILQTFIDGRYDRVNGGRQLNEDEIVGLLIAAQFASMHTSSITSAWTGIYLADNPEAWMACVREQKDVVKAFGEDISMEALNAMPVLHACITEALRLQPPLIMVLRYARQAFTVKDSRGHEFYIPRGDVCCASLTAQHRLNKLFKDADNYDHTRFLPPRSEDKTAKFTFIGFGGGRHGCMGTNFAYLQIKTVWSYLLRSFEFKLLDQVPEPDFTCLVVGPKPCRVEYTRRRLPI